ncbi:hypothetical protein SpCBS45565_g02664 [Spizellomyces sp. 'palustris']|nr:hypothetical protein SpCBS45565_g02664 [Spizellomyces sp. 'palustris']
MSKDAPPPTEPQHDPTALLAQANKALDDCHPDLARKFLLRALELQPNNVDILQSLGVTEMEDMTAAGEAGEEDRVGECARRAREYFLRAAELRPGQGYAKYLYLGQLSEGKESLEFYESGVEALEMALAEVAGNQEEEAVIRRRLSEALCSMAEIYMTDCCDEPEAEVTCETFSSKAITYDPTNPEAHQTLASVRMSQCRPDDARKAIETSMDIWINSAAPGDKDWPVYPARIVLVKILLELSLHERALTVLQTIQNENDEDPEGWYLFGWCYYRMGGGGEDDEKVVDPAEKAECWDSARECFETVLQLHERYGGAEEEMVEHTSQLLEQISQFLAVHGVDNANSMQIEEERDEAMEL